MTDYKHMKVSDEPHKFYQFLAGVICCIAMLSVVYAACFIAQNDYPLVVNYAK